MEYRAPAFSVSNSSLGNQSLKQEASNESLFHSQISTPSIASNRRQNIALKSMSMPQLDIFHHDPIMEESHNQISPVNRDYLREIEEMEMHDGMFGISYNNLDLSVDTVDVGSEFMEKYPSRKNSTHPIFGFQQLRSMSVVETTSTSPGFEHRQSLHAPGGKQNRHKSESSTELERFGGLDLEGSFDSLAESHDSSAINSLNRRLMNSTTTPGGPSNASGPPPLIIRRAGSDYMQPRHDSKYAKERQYRKEMRYRLDQLQFLVPHSRAEYSTYVGYLHLPEHLKQGIDMRGVQRHWNPVAPINRPSAADTKKLQVLRRTLEYVQWLVSVETPQRSDETQLSEPQPQPTNYENDVIPMTPIIPSNEIVLDLDDVGLNMYNEFLDVSATKLDDLIALMQKQNPQPPI